MMLSLLSLRRNQLLAALPQADFDRLLPHLEPVSLVVGELVYESGAAIAHVLFPTTAIVSLQYVMESGASAEFAGVGNEGLVGVSLFMGGDSTLGRAIVQTGGQGFLLKRAVLLDEFKRTGALMRLSLLYTQALLAQMSLTAACNRRHSVEQQLCRWLLLALDRTHGNELAMTQELISSMLGVRREGVTEVAGRLQQAGIISYRRGRITVLQREGLEHRVCECYGVVRREFQRLLPTPAHAGD